MFSKKQEFIEFTLHEKILKFGSFTLKSGRKSPYFFNTGLCNNGKLLDELSSYYADYISENSLDFDFIFGPAYKGITLCSSICHSLYKKYSINKPFAFNRKEEKKHGDMGKFVGCPITGISLIVDDVISSGSSIVESIEMITESKAACSDVLVAFDRMEVGENKVAAKEISEKFTIKVHSLISLNDISNFIKSNSEYKEHIQAMDKYILEHGAN